MGERLLCKQEVVGSIPSASTSPLVSRRWRSQEVRGRVPQHGNVRLVAIRRRSGIMDSVKKKCK